MQLKPLSVEDLGELKRVLFLTKIFSAQKIGEESRDKRSNVINHHEGALYFKTSKKQCRYVKLIESDFFRRKIMHCEIS